MSGMTKLSVQKKKENQLDAWISEIEMNLPIGPLDIWQVLLSSINPGSFGSSGFLNLVENLYGFRSYAPKKRFDSEMIVTHCC